LLTQSFCHVPGLGAHTERGLWKSGCLNWQAFLSEPERFAVGSAGTDFVRNHIDCSVKALESRHHQFFADGLGNREAWRAWPEFSDSICYLDIETDGGQSGDSITTVGIYDGENLGSFPDVISRYGMIVTFFGQGFDIPMLKKAFPQVPFDHIHLDLCFALKRVGVRGGLKKIEKQFGISRGDDTDGLSGLDAIRLWREYQRGREQSLETLIEYNKEDVVNLQTLAAITYGKLRAEALAVAGLTEADFLDSQARLF
jgi:uncharacterized protein